MANCTKNCIISTVYFYTYWRHYILIYCRQYSIIELQRRNTNPNKQKEPIFQRRAPMKSITNHLMLFQTCAYTGIRLPLHLSRDNGHDPRFWRRRKGQPSNNGTRICNPQPEKAQTCAATQARASRKWKCSSPFPASIIKESNRKRKCC